MCWSGSKHRRYSKSEWYSEYKNTPFTTENIFLHLLLVKFTLFTVKPQHKYLIQSSIKFSNKLITKEVYKLFVAKTNRYTEELFVKNAYFVHGRIAKWKAFIVPDLKIFLGLFFSDQYGPNNPNLRLPNYQPLFCIPITLSWLYGVESISVDITMPRF